MSYLIGPMIPLVLDFWECLLSGFQSQSGHSFFCTWQRHEWCMFLEIHLWCNTCRTLDCQHGGRPLLFPTCVFQQYYLCTWKKDLNKKEEVIKMWENNDNDPAPSSNEVKQQTSNLRSPSRQKGIRVFVQLPYFLVELRGIPIRSL